MKYVFFGKEITVASTMGHAIHFPKGVAVEVPRIMEADVIARGGVPEDMDATPDVDPDKPQAPDTAGAREKAMFNVFEAMVLENDAKKFTSGGSPKESVVEAALGWSVDRTELNANWKKFKAQGT